MMELILFLRGIYFLRALKRRALKSMLWVVETHSDFQLILKIIMYTGVMLALMPYSFGTGFTGLGVKL